VFQFQMRERQFSLRSYLFVLFPCLFNWIKWASLAGYWRIFSKWINNNTIIESVSSRTLTNRCASKDSFQFWKYYYEKLWNFCSNCGILSHEVVDRRMMMMMKTWRSIPKKQRPILPRITKTKKRNMSRNADMKKILRLFQRRGKWRLLPKESISRSVRLCVVRWKWVMR